MRIGRALALTVALLATPALAMSTNDPAPPAAGQPPTAYDVAVQEVKAENFAAALPLLEGYVAINPGNADAWNHLGYSQRKLGQLDAALVSYGKALALQPEHRGANEYLGELYLEMGDLAAAKQRLAVLDRACWLPCEEYTELKERIEDYERRQAAKSS
jgi:predicted Zn-dependent protease